MEHLTDAELRNATIETDTSRPNAFGAPNEAPPVIQGALRAFVVDGEEHEVRVVTNSYGDITIFAASEETRVALENKKASLSRAHPT